MVRYDIAEFVKRSAPLPAGNHAADLLTRLRATLSGRRVLVVEDEFLTADEIAVAFARVGVGLVGPANSLRRALELLDTCGHLDGAVLDINMRGEMVFPVADALRKRGVPFIFATGYDPAKVVPERFRDVSLCMKPIDPLNVVQALFPNSGPTR